MSNKNSKLVTAWRVVLTMEDGSHVDFDIDNDQITVAIDDFIAYEYDTEWDN